MLDLKMLSWPALKAKPSIEADQHTRTAQPLLQVLQQMRETL